MEEQKMTGKTDEHINNIIEELIKINKNNVIDLVSRGVSEGIDPMQIINEGLTVGLRKVGDLFAEEEIFLPELVLAGKIVTEATENIKSKMVEGQNLEKKGLFLISTVSGDVHDIGKNLVALLLSASGYQVEDLGKDVLTETIVEKVNELNPNIVGLSSLLSTTMPAQKDVIEALEKAGIRDKVKIMVGGAPVTRAWAEEVGADGYAENASEAVNEADKLIHR
jgi:corrinoid protein of di/trimethylamine methyltransferase